MGAEMRPRAQEGLKRRLRDVQERPRYAQEVSKRRPRAPKRRPRGQNVLQNHPETGVKMRKKRYQKRSRFFYLFFNRFGLVLNTFLKVL